MSPYAAKRTIATCKKLNYVENVVSLGDKKSDSLTISLTEFVRKNEKKDFNVEKNVSVKVDIKEQVSLIVCSSGTTGLPKGVLLTQENMMSVIQSYRDIFVIQKMVHGETLVILNIAPWFHALGSIIHRSRSSFYF